MGRELSGPGRDRLEVIMGGLRFLGVMSDDAAAGSDRRQGWTRCCTVAVAWIAVVVEVDVLLVILFNEAV